MGAHTRRNVIVVTAVVAVAGGAFAIASSSGGSDKKRPAAETSAISVVTPTTDQPSASATDVTSGETADASPSSSASSSSAGGPGAYAADGVTPLSTFPSLVKFSQVFAAGSGRVVTTIDPRYQSAAAAAVSAHPDSAMVVLRASTGEILAMASNGAADFAYHAERAPGSTFKVVTAEDLLRNGVTPGSPAPCPAKDPTFGITNDDTQVTNNAATLRYGFVYSCNTSFTGLMPDLDAHPLDLEASNYFGLNQPWDLGVGPAVYGAADGIDNVRPAKDYGFASEMFGQGPITVSPLNMASVAATVDAGQFHQPFLVPNTRATAHALPLDKTVDADLREMMRAVVTEGTASSLRAVSPPVSAKTGTAQPGDGGGNDSWMVAFQGDIAVACLVEHGGHGDAAAGPEIAAMFNAPK